MCTLKNMQILFVMPRETLTASYKGQTQHGVCLAGGGLEGEVDAQDRVLLTSKPSTDSAPGPVISQPSARASCCP